MARTLTRESAELRLKIRMEYEKHPELHVAELRKQFRTTQQIVDSALGKTAEEWATLTKTLPSQPTLQPQESEAKHETKQNSVVMPGLEQGIVKFNRKPAKMGEDFIFWIPRVYIRNGLVDVNTEYEVHLKKKMIG